MRIKTISLHDNGDYDILVSFSKEDIDKIGIDTTYHILEKQKELILMIWNDFKKEIKCDDKRLFGDLKCEL